MTANQIAFNKFNEEIRTHMAQEAETQRANMAREAETSRANTLNYNANIYATQAGMHNAQLNADTQREIAGINAATSRAVASTNAAASMYGAQMANEASHYNTDTQWAIQSRAQHETARHNMVMEQVQQQEANAKTGSTVSQILNTAATIGKIAFAIAA